jgi:flavin reductase (DIM6/NTAB) family NADH-FMN oxidoreductase RutF
VSLVGSKCADQRGGWNVAPVSNISCMSNEPQRIGIAVYKKWATCANIQHSREFSVNMADRSLLAEIWISAQHYSNLKYPPSISKMELVRLTAAPGTVTNTPLFAECYANLECKVAFDLSTGDHHLFVGDVVAAWVREDAITPDATLNLESVTPVFQNSNSEFWFPSQKEVINMRSLQGLLDERAINASQNR